MHFLSFFLKITYLDPDPDSEGKMNADPCRSGSGSTALLLSLYFFQACPCPSWRYLRELPVMCWAPTAVPPYHPHSHHPADQLPSGKVFESISPSIKPRRVNLPLGMIPHPSESITLGYATPASQSSRGMIPWQVNLPRV